MGPKSDNRSYYEVLHVSRDAPLEIIRGSYRTLMQRLKHHPDLGGDAATAALINEAYAVLSNAEKRAEYDARMDVMARVAEGVTEVQPERGAARRRPRAEARVLDWTRQCVFCETPHAFGRNIEVDMACRACESPLSAAERHRIESEGQRAIERVGKRMRVAYYTHWPQPRAYSGYVEDMSLNGLRLVANRELIEGQCIKIVSDVVEAVAQVTHTLYERRGWSRRCVAGMSFVTLRFGRSAGGFVSSRV
ncbi:MAG: J domain-containing protein [Woeseiaceae bacterium]